MTNESNPTQDMYTQEDYAKAMNFIAQNLFSSLVQSIEKLPNELSNRKVVAQALSAFLANVIYKQFPNDADLSSRMLNDFTNLIQTQLNEMHQPIN